MAHTIIMPKSGMAMEEGTVVRWLKKVGDTISKGEAIAVIETDKVTMDLESDYDGTLLAIVHGDGDVVIATHTIAWVGAPGETVPAGAEAAADSRPTDGAAAHAPAAPAPVPAAPAPVPATDGKVPATPAARARAASRGIPLSSIAGSGPGGAVRLRDFPAAAGPAHATGTPLPMTGMRRAIASRMLRSHQQVPSVTLVTRADVTELAALRDRVNAGGAESASRGAESASRGATKVSYTDFILRAAAMALRGHPLVNSVIEGDGILLQSEINIGIAVALDDGLVVPVVKRADTLGVRQIAAAVRDLADRARAGTLSPQEYAGGTFTITNLGMYGITEFTPLINVPESAILGVGSIEEAFRTGAAGAIESRKVMSLCLTHDHRHIDGAPAARFLGSIRRLLEDCYLLVV